MIHNQDKLDKLKAALVARNYVLDPTETAYKGIEKYKYKYTCNKGHKREAVGKSILTRGCLLCSMAKLRHVTTRKKWSIQDMRRIARKHGGECLSKVYKNKGVKLTWQCKNGHRWTVAPHNIMHNGAWCVQCLHKRYTLEDMQEDAAKRGGECLSDIYKKISAPLQWKCAKKHEWEAKAIDVIVKNLWCPQCEKDEKDDDETETEIEIETETEAETDNETETETETEIEIETKPEADAKSDDETETETEIEVKTKTKIKIKIETTSN